MNLSTSNLDSLRSFVRSGEKPLHSCLISVDGQLILEEYAPGFDAATLAPLYSVTKSVVSLLVGMALDRVGGEAILHHPIAELLVGLPQGEPDGRRDRLTLFHLLAQTSGIKWKETGRPWGPGHDLWEMEHSDHWVGYVLSREMSAEPGERFTYNSGVSHLLPMLAGRLLDADPLGFAITTLLGPMGISDIQWGRDPQGHLLGGKGLHMRPRDMLALGEMVLGGGRYQGREVVPQWWIDVSTRAYSRGHNFYGEYCLHWWRWNGLLCAVGFGGQYIFISPERNLVIVFTGMLKDKDFSLPRELLMGML